MMMMMMMVNWWWWWKISALSQKKNSIIYAFHNRQSRLLCTCNQEAGVLFQIQFWPLILSCCCCCRGINLVGAAIIGVWEGEQGEGAPFVHTSTNKSVRRVCFSTGGFFLLIFGRFLNFMVFKFPIKSRNSQEKQMPKIISFCLTIWHYWQPPSFFHSGQSEAGLKALFSDSKIVTTFDPILIMP